MDPLDLISGTAEAVYGVDEAGRIVVWNEAAERLLGFPAGRVLGKFCHEVLHGRDVFGNPYCDRACPLRRMVRRSQPVRAFELDVGRSDGGLARVSVSVLCVPGPRSPGRTILHLVRPLPRASPPAEPAADGIKPSTPSPPGSPQGSAGADPIARLTRREAEVLRLLAAGTGTRRIAARLFISVATVRTHIESILRKLEVHSRLEAASLAHRNHLD